MEASYNRIAGQSLHRLAGLSDGLFAVAMTLLVLDLRVPALASVHGERDLWQALVALAPRLMMYLMSFATLGIFWAGQQTQLNHRARGDRDLAWIHLGFLFVVSLMPFSTMLIAEFLAYRTALLLYWGNILLLGAILYAGWKHAVRAGLVKPDAPADLACAVERRILVAQGLYAMGAALCVFDTRLSIGMIILVQANYVLAPRILRLDRL